MLDQNHIAIANEYLFVSRQVQVIARSPAGSPNANDGSRCNNPLQTCATACVTAHFNLYDLGVCDKYWVSWVA